MRRFVERMFGYIEAMLDDVRSDRMMARLLDDLRAGTDIGHYGRLVFAMVARHFADEAELIEALADDRDFDATRARAMLREVIDADYSPPKREKILDFQSRQDYPIIENPDDPDLGNVYRDLRFPDEVYRHIEHYREAQVAAER